MNLYAVVSGGRAYVMPAPNIQAASQFVRHRRPGVRVVRVTDLNVLANAGLLTNPAHILQHLTGIDCGAVARYLEQVVHG